jgi:hypothetical protein
VPWMKGSYLMKRRGEILRSRCSLRMTMLIASSTIS